MHDPRPNAHAPCIDPSLPSPQAARYFRAAAAAHDTKALVSLAHMHAMGTGVKQENETAFRLFSEAAEKGDSNAQNGLGYLHLHGQVRLISDSRPRSCARPTPRHVRGLPACQAATTLSLFSFFPAGHAARRGHGAQVIARPACAQSLSTPPLVDPTTHRRYFKLAAEQDNVEALYNLGALYLAGVGVERQTATALQYSSLLPSLPRAACGVSHRMPSFALRRGAAALYSASSGVLQVFHAGREARPHARHVRAGAAALGGPGHRPQLRYRRAAAQTGSAHQHFPVLADDRVGGSPARGCVAVSLCRCQAAPALRAELPNFLAQVAERGSWAQVWRALNYFFRPRRRRGLFIGARCRCWATRTSTSWREGAPLPRCCNSPTPITLYPSPPSSRLVTAHLRYARAAEEGYELAQANSAWLFDSSPSAVYTAPDARADTPVAALVPLAPVRVLQPFAFPPNTSRAELRAFLRAGPPATGPADPTVANAAGTEQQPGHAEAARGENSDARAAAEHGASEPAPKRRPPVAAYPAADPAFGAQQAYKLALRHLTLASEQGNVEAVRLLGDYAFYGHVAGPDLQEAARRCLAACVALDALITLLPPIS